MTDIDFYLVWSNQHGMWWGPHKRGYTNVIDEAGRYPRAEAEAIVRDATVDGQIFHERVDPVAGIAYRSYDEVAVLAPESTPAVEPAAALDRVRHLVENWSEQEDGPDAADFFERLRPILGIEAGQ